MKHLNAPTPDEYKRIVDRASELSSIPAHVLMSLQRTAKVSQWRHAIFYVLRCKGATFKEIGDYFDRHHATVIHGCKTLDRHANDPNVRNIISELSKPSKPTAWHYHAEACQPRP